MKKILIALLLIIGIAGHSQGNHYAYRNGYLVSIPGYTNIFSRYKYLAIAVDSGMHVPQYNGVPSGVRGGVWSADGAISMDTTTGYFYGYFNGSWVKMAKYSDITANIPTWQQVLTAGSTLTTNNKVTLGTTKFSIVSSGVDTMFKIDPVNLQYGFGDMSGAGNATSIHITDAAGLVRIDGDVQIQGMQAYNDAHVMWPLYWDGTNQYLAAASSPDSLLTSQYGMWVKRGVRFSGIPNNISQDRLLGQVGAGGQVGYITLGTGLAINSGKLNVSTSTASLVSYKNSAMTDSVKAYVFKDSLGVIYRVYEPNRNNDVRFHTYTDKFPFDNLNCYNNTIDDVNFLNLRSDLIFQGNTLSAMVVNGNNHLDLTITGTTWQGNYGVSCTNSCELYVNGRFATIEGSTFGFNTFVNKIGVADSTLAIQTKIRRSNFGTKVGLGFNGSATTITDCTFSDFSGFDADSSYIDLIQFLDVQAEYAAYIEIASGSVSVFSTTFNENSSAVVNTNNIIGSSLGQASSVNTANGGVSGVTLIDNVSLSPATNISNITLLNNPVGIGLSVGPSAKLHVLSTTEQQRLAYDASNYLSTTISSAGVATIKPTGSVINWGGGTTATETRFLEPSGSGTNYSAFKAVAQSANITYSLPPTVGAAGTVLTDVAGNGVLTWAAGGGGGTPGGSTTQVQFNDAGAFGGDAGFVYDKTNDYLTLGTSGVANYNLNMYGSTYSYLSMQTSGSGTGGTDGFQLGYENTGVFFIHRENTPMYFYTNNTARLNIDAGGNVYVGGTAVADAKLHTVATTEQFRIGYDGSNYASNTVSSAGVLTIAPTGASITVTKPVVLKGYTVATLPTGVTGMVAYVTDALAPSFLVTIVGGGSVVTPVFFNGSNWVAQ